MYARLLFVVVGISGPVLDQACFGLYQPPDALVSDPRLGIAGGCGYTLAA